VPQSIYTVDNVEVILMNESNKKNMAEEKVLLARMLKDFGLYSAQDVFEQHLEKEEFFTQDGNFSLKYVAPYERKGRKDKNSDGFDKPKVKVNAFFRKVLSLRDHRELYGVNKSLKSAEHTIHTCESEWHNNWKERVKDFCEIERRFYPNGTPTKSGYKIADAYYEKVNTVIEFQKSFDDEALSKCEFYTNEKIKLIWLFYIPTLSVFEESGIYKIREDNFYHFFRIESLMPDFYSDNIVFLQDKNNKIYHIKTLGRVATNIELDGTIRYFEKGLFFLNQDEFTKWLQFEWESSKLCSKVSKQELKSIEEILEPFVDKPDKMFFLQNCLKKDINGADLIYCFIKDDGVIRKDNGGMGYLGYRCFVRFDGNYSANSSWTSTKHNPKTKKWHLLATNCHKYSDLIEIEEK
jgi:hypothetical protein